MPMRTFLLFVILMPVTVHESGHEKFGGAGTFAGKSSGIWGKREGKRKTDNLRGTFCLFGRRQDTMAISRWLLCAAFLLSIIWCLALIILVSYKRQDLSILEPSKHWVFSFAVTGGAKDCFFNLF
jgi:hypothetical protein